VASIPSSGQLSMGALADNNSSASKANISLQTESVRFASASIVGDVDGNSTANQAADRTALRQAPHALSEFRGANFPSSIITGITFTTEGSDTNTVDTEDLDVTFTTNGQAGTYTVRLIDSSGNTDLSGTRSGAGTVTFSNLSLTEDTYRPQVQFDTFNVVNDDATFTHHDALSGGSTSLTNATQTVDAADESVSNVQITAAVSSGTQEGFKVAQSVVVGGDGGNITSNVNTSATHTSPQTVTISNPPGQLRFTTTHIGDPSEARNNDSSTADVTITYNRAIDGVGTLDTSNAGKTQFNSGDTIRVFAVSEGVQGVTMKMGYGTANNNTTYTSDDNKSISDSRFVRSSQTFDTSRTLTSGTSLETFFPKANYTSGDATLSAGSSFSVAPAFSYNTPGDTTINVNQTRGLDVSSVVGNNASVAITSSPDKGSGTNTATLSPGTANAVYTITYTGTANFSQTSNQTDTVTVRPTVSLSSNNNSPKGLASSYASGRTPTGVSEPTITISTSTVGDTISATNFGSLPANFTKTGGGDGVSDFLAGKFSGGSAGDRTFTATVSGNSTTSTEASVTVSYGLYSQQIIQSVSPDSGDFRRGVTTLNVQWQARNVALVDIDLIGVSTGTSDTNFVSNNDSLDSTTADALENQNHSATIPDVGINNVGTYNIRVRDASDNVPEATTLSAINILDLEPTTPGAFNDSSGTYHGTLALDWSASSYRFQYQIFKSSGDADSSYSQLGSNQTGTSVNISETNGTTTNGPFYYKVRAINFAQGPLSTETSNFNSPVRIIVMPTLDADNNSPSPVSSTIFSTTNNSSSTSTTMQVSSKSDNTNLGFSYALSNNTAGVSISNSTTETPTITAGSGVGHVDVTLTVTGDPSQTFVHGADRIQVNYFPKFTTITFTSGTIIQNTDNLNVTRLVWQGFDASSGFRVGVFDASSGGNEISSNGTIDITGGTLTSGLSSGAGGVQNKDTEWLGNINLGTISDSGTVFLRVTDLGAGGVIGQESVTISAFNLVSITAGPEDTAEEALEGSATPASKFFLGTLGNGVTLFNGAGGTGGAFNGNNKFFLFNQSGTLSVGKVNGSGVISEFNAEANVPPLAPTGLSFSSVSTDRMTLNWTDNSSIEDEYYIFFKTGTSNDADFNDTAFSGNPLSANDTSEQVTGLSSGQSFSWAVYARNGSSYSNPLRGTQSTTAPSPLISVSGGTSLSETTSFDVDLFESTVLTVSSSNRNSTAVKLKVQGTNDGGFEVGHTTDGSNPGTPGSTSYTSIGSGTSAEVTLSDANIIKVRLKRNMSSVGTFSINFRFQIGSNVSPNTSTVTQTFIRSDGGGGGEPGKCIDSTMLINMSDGLKHISDVKDGDFVLSYNNEKSEKEYVRVDRIIKVKHDNVYRLRFNDDSEMMLTDDHPIVSDDNRLLTLDTQGALRKYNMHTEKLIIGDKVRKTDGVVKVKQIEKVIGERDTYTIITENENFYANDVLVHQGIEDLSILDK